MVNIVRRNVLNPSKFTSVFLSMRELLPPKAIEEVKMHIVSATYGRSSCDEDVQASMQDLVSRLDLNGAGPAVLFVATDQQLYESLMRLRLLHPEVHARIVPLLAAGHNLWSSEGIFLLKWGEPILHSVVEALWGKEAAPKKFESLSRNKNHRSAYCKSKKNQVGQRYVT